MTHSPILPFPRSYWVLPGKLLAGCYPGDTSTADAEEKLRGLLRCGVSHVVNLMESHEVDHQRKPFTAYDSLLRELAMPLGRNVVCTRHSIRDLSVPEVVAMGKLLDSIDAALANGNVVYVHCWGGRGRTGTVIGCYLARHGISTEGQTLAMLARLTDHQRSSFRRIPETDEQRAFVNAWRFGQ